MGEVYYCEVCGEVMQLNDLDEIEIHRRELKHHKIKKLLLLKCASCARTVADIFAEYSQERNEFWCRECIQSKGYSAFRTEAQAC